VWVYDKWVIAVYAPNSTIYYVHVDAAIYLKKKGVTTNALNHKYLKF